MPLACVTFAAFFYSRKAMPTVESLARKAIEFTDVNAIASDGWFLLARKEHQSNDPSRAGEYYKKADEARGGLDKGYLPAKLGVAQIQGLMEDRDGAKFRLEKVIQQSKSIEAMIMLGTIYAEEVSSHQATSLKDDKATERKKRSRYLKRSALLGRIPPSAEVQISQYCYIWRASTKGNRQRRAVNASWQSSRWNLNE